MKDEDFPINKKILDEFINYNSSLWVDDKFDIDDSLSSSGKTIFINLSMVRMQVAWIIPKLLFAKGIQSKHGGNIVAITWRENSDLTEFFSSFGVGHYCIEKENKKNISSAIRALAYTIKVIMYGDGEKLKKFSIGNIPVGRAIYEDILRTSEISTIRSIRNYTCIKKIFHLLWMYFTLEDYLKNHKPSFDICDDCAYHEAMQTALFSRNGAVVYNCSEEAERFIGVSEEGIVKRISEDLQEKVRMNIDTVSEEDLECINRILEDRFAGKNGRNIDRHAFAGKKVLSKEEAFAELGLNPKKKTVIIMAHTFTDAVFNYGDTPFKDYYDWTEQTLRIASLNDHVNWILKPHPTRKAYHESKDSIEDLFKRYKTDNMHFLEDRFSAESIKNFVDVLITIGGNAGAEFSCFGIPAVIVGSPYYKGLGYTIEPGTLKEYEDILGNIQDINRLNDSQIKTARKAFFLTTQRMDKMLGKGFNDRFCIELKKKYNNMLDEMTTDYFESNKGTEKYNTEILKFVEEWQRTNDIKECDYYLRGTEK